MSGDAGETWGGEASDGTGGASLGRFEHLGVLGRGGMGDVHRVRDPVLGRTMALKVLRTGSVSASQRFVDEARLSARLQHPCLVPVHELGTLPDGRAYFTMREVDGHTLGEAIATLHAGDRTAWEPGLRRLVQVLQQVAGAIAYAHGAGVVHRDLKPDNVMLGAFGEVFVLDWGIARHGGARPVASTGAEPAPGLTRAGDILGTPIYMAPEQAGGEPEAVGPAADVWGLGGLLHELLTGRPPMEGDGLTVLLRLHDPSLRIDPRRHGAPGPVDDALWQLCEACLQPDLHRRPAGARAVAEALGAWLEGVTARARGLAMVAEAEALQPEVERLRSRARAERAAAEAELAAVPLRAPSSARHAAWARADAAAALEVEAGRLDQRVEARLRGALGLARHLPEAHVALAQRALAAHADAERRADRAAAARAEADVAQHARALPEGHADARRLDRWLQGEARLTLHTEPSGARVRAVPVVERHRRWVEGDDGLDLGVTPLDAVVLPAGRWVLHLEADGRVPTVHPVWLARSEHADGVVPGGEGPFPVVLPHEVPEGMVYVPAGFTHSGGEAIELPERRLWVDAFFLGRDPVTVAAYGAFLEARQAQGHDIDPWLPRMPAGRYGNDGPGLLEPGPDGRFRGVPDEEGHVLGPDHPIVSVDFASAQAYVAWLRETTGRPYRLPGVLEWEKAARGPDGRTLPWGDTPDPSRCNNRDAHEGLPLPTPVDAFPDDTSVYGVRGCAGNVRDWSGDRHRDEGPPVVDGRAVRPPVEVVPAPGELIDGVGGAWPLRFAQCRLGRTDDRPDYRHPGVGFRIALDAP